MPDTQPTLAGSAAVNSKKLKTYNGAISAERQRLVWFISFVGVHAKLYDPLTTRAIFDCFCDEFPS